MKRLLLIAVLLGAFQGAFATTHEVEVGGNLSITPYYEPQFLNIELGDTVRFIWDTGTHNVTSTSGPSSFASGDLSAPATWDLVLSLTGFYTFECSLFNHAETQFGSINVVPATVSVDENKELSLEIYPNPAQDVVNIKGAENMDIENVQILTNSGQLARNWSASEDHAQLFVQELRSGVYFVVINTTTGVIKERLVIRE